MKELSYRCTKYVDLEKKCIYCSNKCVKNGRSYGKQRYFCRSCKKSFVDVYSYKECNISVNQDIKEHIKEGCSVRSIARLLKISVTTVQKRTILLAKKIVRPMITMGKEYEMDELCTYVREKNNQVWVAYAMRKDTKEVIDFSIGRRTLATLSSVTDTLLLANASKVYTDKLKHYASLLPKAIHKTKKRGTNHIERKNLTLRTHLKRLSRRTICFSRKKAFLSACLNIYFWG